MLSISSYNYFSIFYFLFSTPNELSAYTYAERKRSTPPPVESHILYLASAYPCRALALLPLPELSAPSGFSFYRTIRGTWEVLYLISCTWHWNLLGLIEALHRVILMHTSQRATCLHRLVKSTAFEYGHAQGHLKSERMILLDSKPCLCKWFFPLRGNSPLIRHQRTLGSKYGPASLLLYYQSIGAFS